MNVFYKRTGCVKKKRYIVSALLISLFLGGIVYLLSNSVVLNYKIYLLTHFYREREYIDFAKAVIKSDLEKMEAGLKGGVDINRVGKREITFLYLALVRKNFESFSFLLKNGADPNYSPSKGYSIVTYCLDLEDSKFIEELLKYEVELNRDYPNRRRVLVVGLSSTVSLENFEILLKSGIELNYATDMGNDPFASALIYKQYRKIILLLKYGGEISASTPILFNDESAISLREHFIELFRDPMFAEPKGSERLKEQQELVTYLKERHGIEVSPLYPEGR